MHVLSNNCRYSKVAYIPTGQLLTMKRIHTHKHIALSGGTSPCLFLKVDKPGIQADRETSSSAVLGVQPFTVRILGDFSNFLTALAERRDHVKYN